MKNFLKIFILVITILLTLGGFSGAVLAVAPLDVQFVPDPLFNQPNFLPLDVASGTATVTNNSDATQTILTEAINISDSDNFGSLLHLKIEGGSVLFDDSLANFFSSAGEIPLGTISNGESKIFTYTISFIDSNDNSYQGKTLGFDICVGFEGGTQHCGDTVIGEEGGDGDGDGGGGGGGTTTSGSSGSGSIHLIIFNEQALNITNVDNSGSATITWNTNLLATSHVVYGPASGGPYTLDLNPPDFGYPFYTIEDPTKVINHSMPLTGLTPGETYLYRVISRASPPTISPEHQFTVPLLLAQVPNSPGQVLGASTEGDSSDSGSVLGESTEIPNENLAAVLASGFGNLLSVCILLALLVVLVIYLIWKLYLRRKYEQSGASEEEIYKLSFMYFGGSSALISIILLILKNYCPLPVFLLLFAWSVCLYLYRKFRTK